MRMEWNIAKERGNLRPLLTYSVSLEEHEKALALPPVRIISTIPMPEEHWQAHCYPGRYERSGGSAPTECYPLEAPSHKGRTWTQSLRLPWRQDNRYPEVEESFLLLRAAVESELTAAYASAPIHLAEELQTTARPRAIIAPGVLGERFLALRKA